MTSNTSVDLSVQGMHCGSCVARVKAALEKVPGVASAAVDLADERARVVLEKPDVPPSALTAAVEGAGYKASVLSGQR